jgi:hypothetical protein
MTNNEKGKTRTANSQQYKPPKLKNREYLYSIL